MFRIDTTVVETLKGQLETSPYQPTPTPAVTETITETPTPVVTPKP